MPDLARIPPARRPELVLSPRGTAGLYVLKDPQTGAYYQLGEEEAFLLSQLDGRTTTEAVLGAFEARFGQPLAEAELGEFVALAQAQGFLSPSGEAETAPEGPPANPPGSERGQTRSPPPPCPAIGASVAARRPCRQSLLYWRYNIFDPDRFFAWLEPKTRFFWTAPFCVLSLLCVLGAAILVWANRHELVSSFAHALCWQTLVLAWFTLALVTTCHEFAHGLTCKHYGGEIHEVGFLLLCFMPGFYCNVSDAWLFPEKSRRLAVTLAGGYFELFLWALAVFAWRLTPPDSLANYLAWVVLSVCGTRVFFNFNPLLKLDGYYLLSDWLAVPNLQQRSQDYLLGHLRRLLWGAPRPVVEPRGALLLTYGAASCLCLLAFLALTAVALARFLGARWGMGLGGSAALLLVVVPSSSLFEGILGGEVRKMLLLRHKRTAAWLLGLGALPTALSLVTMEDWAGGPFRLRPAGRAEVRAPVAGFVQAISCDEGDRVSAGTLIARLEVPDLASRLAQRRAELREARANLRLLEEGPRPREVVEQRRRAERAAAWRDLARQDLAHARESLHKELARLEKQVAQHDAELEHALASLERARRLRDGRTANVISGEEYGEVEMRCRVCRAQLEQARAEREARQALGTQDAEAELARREKELADAQAALALLEAGSRPEEVEVGRARLARVQEEVRYFEGVQKKEEVCTPVAGLVTTPRLREKVGTYVQEGEPLCTVEEPAALEAEVSLAEQEAARVRVGQVVQLKTRALPFQTLTARVERVAPVVGPGEVQGTVTVYCTLESPGAELRPGMTGHARIGTGRRVVGAILLDRALRFLRTEFWW